MVTMDWTEFDKDDQTTLSLALFTPKNRAIPLVWLSVAYEVPAENGRPVTHRRAPA